MFRIVICEDEFLFRSFLVEAINKVFIEEGIDVGILEFNCGEALLDNYPEKVDPRK